jgi:NADPH-dependent 2,4-dienoyl-CoA reductase/sulfur reductase-like enzyme
MKVIIVGGVAGGASCAARLRRLDETAEILMVERGPYVSYANCGLPYHVSGVIPKESSLLVANEQYFKANLGIEARTNCEAVSIDRKKKTVGLKNVKTGAVTTESYDKLVLSPGAASIRPPLPGIDLPGIFQVRTVPDARTIREWIEKGTAFLTGMYNYSGIQFVKPPRYAVVIGGGFIGLETAENLVHAGFEVTLVEMLDQVLAPLDRELACLVEGHLTRHGVHLALSDGVAGFTQLDGGALEVQTKSGKTFPADIVILSLGVRPDTTLAKAAGLAIGERGGIRVDEHMRTSDPDIFAVGDAIEVKDFVTGEPAGPHRRRRHRRARFPLPRHAGHLDHRALRRRRRLDRRQREDAQEAGRRGLREDLPLPELARRVLPGRQADRAEAHLPQVRRTPPRRASAGRRRTGGGQAHQRPRGGPADEGDDLRPRGGRALLRTPVRQRQGPGQLRRDGRRRRDPGRHAARPLGRHRRRVSA